MAATQTGNIIINLNLYFMSNGTQDRSLRKTDVKM